MKSLNLTRKEIYDLVWEKPVSHLAEELGIKPSELRGYCVKFEIPLPEQGHWSRVQFGKEVTKTPLPPASVNELSEEIVIEEKEIYKVDPPIMFPGENELSFKVPDRLINPDPLIVVAENGLKRTPWSKKDMHSTETDQLPIRVSKSNIARALRIMDTLVKCWKRRGYEITIQDGEAYVHLRKVRDRISLREISKKLPKKGEYYVQELEPTGQLAFRMDWWGGKEWKDGRLPLEDQILAILNHMELSARQLERSWAEDATKKEEQEALQNQKAFLMKNQQAEESAFKTLIEDALRWKELKVLDEYLAELVGKQTHTSAFLEWLNWAKQKRISEDPLLNF
ncbi:hypothetical protein [Mucilaginibacter phyllosphaerae]|uniref:Uncharacterized protein n=1 Tax=Mucilaginibacter phyllosphaerae TaxID=1812349 RepID=A0A4Y8A579_9SPHI|nr:hypothetical protein [Mucilaginibacter phyllosphaerae]MBB3969517.1 hypothetical protein [Mucilaginibacter phyllosphaerae]TEW63615.1 hypothetical protein E2R65_19300 [Mucilaginibacter phyllosphaerae]GGH23900.1 hypothetical protein GCM10007352_38080 [Mucilaginibacter phyllosphaerae]